jgi:transcriptional regulator with PAS, ATPase and Fis domain
LTEVRLNHSGRSFNVTISGLFDEAGNATGYLHVMRDIVDAADAQKSREKNVEQLNLLFKNAELIITVQDRKGKYLKLRALPGNIRLPESIPGKTPFDFYEPKTAGAICERVRRVTDTGEDLTASMEIGLGEDVYHFVDNISSLRDETGLIGSV